MRIFVIGAAGKIGRRLVRRLAQGGHEAMALCRKPEQAAELTALGGIPVEGDLSALNAATLSELMSGSDVVVFTAGAGGAGIEVTNAIDGRGLEVAVEAARLAGSPRFLLVSVFPDALRDRERSEGFENYIRVKKLADAHLVASDLDWVILRPGTLNDKPGTGLVRAAAAIPYGEISRDDVAGLLAALVVKPEVSRTIIELTEGENQIGEALERLVRA